MFLSKPMVRLGVLIFATLGVCGIAVFAGPSPTPLRVANAAPNEARLHTYFDQFDPTPVTRKKRDAQARATVLVLPPGARNMLVPRGDELCVAEKYLFDLGGICDEQHHLKLCPDDPIVEKLDGMHGVVVGRKPACSGVAIAENEIVTAAHCFKSKRKKARVTGGYAIAGVVHEASPSASMCFSPASVFKLVEAESANPDRDQVVVRVEPLTAGSKLSTVPRCHKPPKEGDEVYARGHPFGFPQFDSGRAKVIESHPPTRKGLTVETDLDLMIGNSGSPVFRADSGCLVGIAPKKIAPGTTKSCCGFESVRPTEDENALVGLLGQPSRSNKPRK